MEDRDGYERHMEMQAADRDAEEAYAASESARAEAVKPQDADLLEQVAQNLWQIPAIRTHGWQIALMIADKAKESLEAAGYRKCPKELWPVVYCRTADEEAVARSQRASDRKRCPAQQGG